MLSLIKGLDTFISSLQFGLDSLTNFAKVFQYLYFDKLYHLPPPTRPPFLCERHTFSSCIFLNYLKRKIENYFSAFLFPSSGLVKGVLRKDAIF
jgi:hypothetical protein